MAKAMAKAMAMAMAKRRLPHGNDPRPCPLSSRPRASFYLLEQLLYPLQTAMLGLGTKATATAIAIATATATATATAIAIAITITITTMHPRPRRRGEYWTWPRERRTLPCSWSMICQRRVRVVVRLLPFWASIPPPTCWPSVAPRSTPEASATRSSWNRPTHETCNTTTTTPTLLPAPPPPLRIRTRSLTPPPWPLESATSFRTATPPCARSTSSSNRTASWPYSSSPSPPTNPTESRGPPPVHSYGGWSRSWAGC
mmetsp:Transcript_19201/g.40257  ORF Transcript_19201/g.40257 Transcript_19201/m.40257 type:complete len:257 (-) Transcript_19201:426-1196(-)